MSGRLRACSSYARTQIIDGWEAGDGIRWLAATVPGTAASCLRDAGVWALDSAPRQFDAEEWWYRTRFTAAPAQHDERLILGFDGLATFAEVSLNGRVLLESSNMFLGQSCDVTALLEPVNELMIRFSPVEEYLGVRRRRPRWRTPMVHHQQLRWVRTTLLGRTPGWSPPAAPVGPWRPAWLERRRRVDLAELRMRAAVTEGTGRLTFSCAASSLGGATLAAARLVAERLERRAEALLTVQPEPALVRGELVLPNVELWWPHTHGEPALYKVSLLLDVRGADGATEVIETDLGSVGFRAVRLAREAGGFALHVNDREVFCRGAAWTPLDCVSLQAPTRALRGALELVRSSGMNMLRVAGPFVYENDEFFELCDSFGILVWQDFMFANMDYPTEDPAFAESVRAEVLQNLSRFQAHPALAVLCGNSEGAQQAAMSGAPRECWAPPFFDTELAALAHELCPDVAYCPSSTHGGAFPFQADEGVTSYYGVGAYLKPVTDARRSAVRFASECLAFANVPEEETLALLLPGQALRCHHPRWKERVPRDLGAGWDFDDVRDHYLESLFRTDARSLRYADHDRYLRLSRVVSGEVMAAAFAEWRSGSTCRGALLWFLADLWPGAGWGVIDSTGLPKAAYYYIKRALQPLAMFVSDEGSNGLMIHLVNDAAAVDVRLDVQLFRHSAPVGGRASKEITVPGASTLKIRATDLYEGFLDLSYAYRFGPPAYDVLRAALYRSDEHAAVAEAFHFPLGLPNVIGADVGLIAAAVLTEGRWQLKISCTGFAQSVHVEAPGFVADDQYFHMVPNSSRTLTLQRRPTAATETPEGYVHALNAATPCRLAATP